MRALWPVHHYRLDLARFAQEAIDGYRRVNDRFAEKLAPHAEAATISSGCTTITSFRSAPGCASAASRNRIGFFLHIPFPPPDVLVAMPEHEWLMQRARRI